MSSSEQLAATAAPKARRAARAARGVRRARERVAHAARRRVFVDEACARACEYQLYAHLRFAPAALVAAAAAALDFTLASISASLRS